MARFTIHDLREELGQLNTRVENAGGGTYLSAESRNGYTGLDEYSIVTDKCIRNIACGSPRECLIAAMDWALANS
jgi:hypothetical protein